MAIEKVPEWKLNKGIWELMVWDLNGTTLNDFRQGWVPWTKYVDRLFGVQTTNIEIERDLIGTNYMEHYWNRGVRPLDDESKADFKTRLNGIRDVFLKNRRRRFLLHEGVINVLAECRRLNMKIALVSAESAEAFDWYVKRFKFDRIFDVTKGNVKSKVDVIAEILSEFKIKPQKSIGIGDAFTDIQDYNALEMDSVAFYCGYNTEKRLLEAKPKFGCHSYINVLSK